MPHRKEQFVDGEIYHIVVKGVDENAIFKDIDDHYREIFSIYELNNAKQVEIRERRKDRFKEKEELKRITQEFQKIKAQTGGRRVSGKI